MATTEEFPFVDGSGSAKLNKCTNGMIHGRMRIG